MPARVALVFEFPTISGGEAAALDFLRRLDRSRYEPVALAPPDGPLAEALAGARAPVTPFRLKSPAGNPPPPQAAAALAQALRDARADLVHANSLALARWSGPAAEAVGIPAIAHCRDIVGLSASSARDVARNRRLVAVSQAVARSLTEQGVPDDRITVIPDGIDAGRAASGVPGKLRAELGVAPGTRLVGCVGQIQPRKGQDVLLEATAFVRARGAEVRCLFVGSRFSSKGEVREFEATLRLRATALGLDGIVRFLGQRSDLPDVLADLDVLAHPARQEPQSIAILEAMAAGCPVVATAVGGTPELIEDGVSGLLVPPADPVALGEAILALLRDPAHAARLGKEARRRAERDFRPEEAATRVFRLYEALLGGLRTPS